MENKELRDLCDRIIEKTKANLMADSKCVAAYVLGSASHDIIWEWSDIQIAVILDDGHKGQTFYSLYEEGMCLAINIYTLSTFKEFLGTVRMDNFMWKAFSKCTKLFSKDLMLDELLDEAFYVGEVDRQKEMLLGFSGAVYYLNKAEKNLYVKGNLENAVYFIPQIAENIAWIEIIKNGKIPERELIPQGKELNPEVFSNIYDPLLENKMDNTTAELILKNCESYLKECTEQVYEPVISHLKKYGNLEHFKYETRPHGFGINYEWLVRCGIAKRYGINTRIGVGGMSESLGYMYVL